MTRLSPRRGSAAVVGTLLIVTLSASVCHAKVKSWHDRAHPIEIDTRWEWLDVAEPTTLKPPTLSAEDQKIREAVEAALHEHGFHHEPREDVDFYLAYELVPPRQQRQPRPPAGRIDGATMGLTIPNLGSGRNDNLLFVEIRDAFRNQPIWRGWYQPLAKQPKKGATSPEIETAIEKIFELLPLD